MYVASSCSRRSWKRTLPWHTFRRLVAKYHGDFNVRSFSCLDQFLCMAFAQLTYRESLRDIEACLRAQPAKLYHLGIRGNVSRSALGRRQRRTRLAHLLRLRPSVDPHRPRACTPTSRSASS